MIYNSSNFHHNSEKRLNVSLFETLSLFFFPIVNIIITLFISYRVLMTFLLFIKSKSEKLRKYFVIGDIENYSFF